VEVSGGWCTHLERAWGFYALSLMPCPVHLFNYFLYYKSVKHEYVVPFISVRSLSKLINPEKVACKPLSQWVVQKHRKNHIIA
jgi:hypothetical protein